MKVVGYAATAIGLARERKACVGQCGALQWLEIAKPPVGPHAGRIQNVAAQIVADAGQKALIEQQPTERAALEARLIAARPYRLFGGLRRE